MRHTPLGPNFNYLKKVKKYLEYKLKPFITIKEELGGGVRYILFSRNGLPVTLLIEYGNFFKTPMLDIEVETNNPKIISEFITKFPQMNVKETENGYVMRYRLNVYSAIFSDPESYEKDKETIKKLYDLLLKY